MNKRADASAMEPEDNVVAPEQGQPTTEAANAQASPSRPARAQRTPWQWQAQETQEERVSRILKAPNPLLEAAQPLLRALAEMPENLPGAQEQPTQGDDKQDPVGLNAESEPHPQSAAMALRYLLAEELKRFQQVCERANIRREHILGAHFLLCTALDEAAHKKPWGTKGWPEHSLLVSLHQDTEGGNKSFYVLGRLVASPDEHLDLIEVFYQVLSLGFVGRYVNQTDGQRQLDAIRQRLLNLISSKREEVPRELSPHWRGAAPGRFGLLRSIPVWVNVTVLALVAFGLFGWFKYQLMFQAHDVEQEILAVGEITPPEPPKALRLAELLRSEIARGVVRVDEDATRSDVIFRGDDMFGGGRAEVSQKSSTDLLTISPEERIAQASMLRARLAELRDDLGIQFPVYVVVTKLDQLVGFTEYFQYLSSEGRTQPWGFTLPLGDKKGKRGMPTADVLARCREEMALLVGRLRAGLNNRFYEEFDEARRKRMLAFRPEFTSLTQPLMELLEHVFLDSRFDDTERRHMLIAQMNAMIGESCRSAIDGKYPFNPTSVQDVDTEDFSRVFASGGVLDDFFQKVLAPHVDTTISPWRYKLSAPDVPPIAGPSLVPFQRAKEIREVFFREPGAKKMAWKVDLKVVELDPEIVELTMDFDGQSLRYVHGPVIPLKVTWPGPRGGQGAEITANPRVRPETSSLIASGPWAMMRVIAKGKLANSVSPSHFVAEYDFDGRKAKLDINTGSLANPWTTGLLQGFQCPGRSG